MERIQQEIIEKIKTIDAKIDKATGENVRVIDYIIIILVIVSITTGIIF